jgi:hypothetical protein
MALHVADTQEVLLAIMAAELVFAGRVFEYVNLGPTMRNLRKLSAPGCDAGHGLQAPGTEAKARMAHSN